jgi:rhamnulokinase
VARNSYLAFDLGAESGRAVLAHLEAGLVRIDEIHRFANTPIVEPASLRWDVHALWQEMQHALGLVEDTELSGIAVDTWGVDYALLGPQGQLLEHPYHYRDVRNIPAMTDVLRLLSRDEIYARTGVQLMPINTLYQLVAARRQTPALLDAADCFVMMPDLFNYWLTGQVACEYTDASTTQLIDPRTRRWAVDLMERVGLPARIAPPIVEPGLLLGAVRASAAPRATLKGTPVVATASHDTASAVAAITARDGTAFISSGTWSLVGMEVDEAVLTPRAMQLNFSNEGGVEGTTRLLKNVMGLWLLQGCRRSWARQNRQFTYGELTDAAAREPGFRHLVDPDAASFANPDDMPDAIDRFCGRTDQPAPSTPGGYARAVFDSLALKYRLVIRDLQSVIERPIAHIRVIGGGSQNGLLNQLTADATGVPVIAGPVEATALGNIAVQMLATGAVRTIAEARAIIDRSFPTTVFTPRGVDAWDRESPRFQQYCGPLHA